MHLFLYFRLLGFLLLNVANKISEENLSKAKLSIFIEGLLSRVHKNMLCIDYLYLKCIDCDLLNSLTVMHLFLYFPLLAFLLLNVANKISEENLSKAKLSIFIEGLLSRVHKNMLCIDYLYLKCIDCDLLNSLTVMHLFLVKSKTRYFY